MKTLKKHLAPLLLVFFLTLGSFIHAHSVQVAYCTNCSGQLRLYVEHWHGSEDPNSTTMTIQLSVNGVVTQQTGSPSGALLQVPFGSLPGCATPATVFGACAGQANTYNDWIYYDFPTVPQNVPITITVISGSNVFTQDGCSMYPAQTIQFTIPANVSPVIPSQSVCGGQNFVPTNFLDAAHTTWTNNNPSIGLPASGSGNVPAFAAATSTAIQTAIITVNTQCSTTQFTLTVQPSPNSAFSFAPISGNNYCKGSTVTFNVANAAGLGSTQWAFGDGGSSSSTNPTHVYNTNGIYSIKLNVTASVGSCTATTTNTLSVYTPTANFNLANKCMGASATFTSTSASPLAFVSQVWNWGDATANGSGATPTHSYTSPGTYPIQLTVTDANLCVEVITKTITIFPNPTITFSANPVCFNTATTFTNASVITGTSSITSWSWDFDNNGTVDNATQSPSTTYTAPGNYTAILTATSSNGCINSGIVNVVVNALPTAAFTAANACLGANISLNNTSNVLLPDNLVNHNWNFGTGASPSLTSSMQNPPSLTYNTSGIKTITLTITANTSCTASITHTVDVFPSPTASFSTTSICQGAATAFTDLTTAGTGTVTGWIWDFTNDGTADNTTQSPNFVYPASGTYTASLIASTSNNCSSTFTLPVNVWGRSIPNFSPDNVCYGTATTFTNLTNTSTNTNLGGVPAYTWAFADGSANSVSLNPIHSYTLGANGNAVYNVTLTATTTNGCINNIVKPVNVYSTPTASFTANTVCLGNATLLNNASNGNGNPATAYQWDFLSDGIMDGTTAASSYTFPTFGTNAVSFTVSTTPVVGLTCSNSITTLTVYVNPLPVPDFTFVNNCINAQPNTFNGSGSNIAVGTNTNYAWAFGDAATTTSITPNTSHIYSNPGVYNVTLTVTSNNGCVANVVKQVEVYKKPIQLFSNNPACDRSAMTFSITQLPGSGNIAEWYWDFDNNISTLEASGQPTVSFTFPAAGNQTVNVITVSNPGQCRVVSNYTVFVDYLPTPMFSVSKKAGCPILCVKFANNTPAVPLPAKNNEWKWVFGDGTSLKDVRGTDSIPNCYDNTSSSQLKNYDVKLVVTTDKGCSDSLKKNSFITVYPKPVASYVVNPDNANVVEPLEYFTNQSQDYTKWYWSFGDNSPFKSDSVNVNPTHFYDSETARTYMTTLIVKNQYGCSDTSNVPIEIGPDFAFYIPNAFTPSNSDNINDVFTGSGIGIDTYNMWIYDRWGELIYHTNDIAKGWDGKKTGKPSEVKQDTYVWKVKIKDVVGRNHDYIGHVTVIK